MATTLDARWAEETPQIQVAIIPFASLVYTTRQNPRIGNSHHPTLHNIHIQVPPVEEEPSGSDGPTGKFKLVFLSTC
eukprot:4815165-Prymnesium_polylepis.1